MRRISKIEPVKPFLGILYHEKSALDEALQRIGNELNPVERLSDSFSFHETDYYEDEMGLDLLRTFAVLQNVIDPSEIKQYKRYCFDLESELARDGKRPINLDPGYINYYHLVLTSVKTLPHKIYLGDGVFAEIEMIYKNKQFQPMDWAYADYRKYTGVFLQFRKRYVEQMREEGHPTIPSPFGQVEK